jgi:hypothetical protein
VKRWDRLLGFLPLASARQVISNHTKTNTTGGEHYTINSAHAQTNASSFHSHYSVQKSFKLVRQQFRSRQNEAAAAAVVCREEESQHIRVHDEVLLIAWEDVSRLYRNHSSWFDSSFDHVRTKQEQQRQQQQY